MECARYTSVLLLVAGMVYGYPPMEDPNLFEGDMILTPDQLKEIQDGSFRRDNLFAARKNPWPRLIAYDLFGLRFEPVARKAIEDAIREFHKYTCLRFIPRTTEREYLRFSDGGGCASSVGYVKYRINAIVLGKQCWSKGIAIHEIMHSLGFHHEQSRPDRDNYIKVHMENVQGFATNNFRKYGTDKIDSLGEPYDFKSIMHYAGHTFAKPGKLAITTIDPSKQSVIGQRGGLSKIDISQINKLYKCKDTIPMTIPVIPTLDPRCSDKYGHCEKYVSYCDATNTSGFGKFVFENCKATCKKCGSIPTKPVVI